MKRLWWSFAAVLVFSFAVLGWIGTRIYQEKPPIPSAVLTTGGDQVIPAGLIEKGQNVWQSMGGMQVGSIWGHGSYVAPDWTADWLHRELVFVLNRWAQNEHQKPYDQLDAERKAALQGRLTSMYKTNSYDPATGVIAIDPVRAEAYRDNVAYYTALFRDGKPEYAIPSGAVPDPERASALASFVWWTAWSTSTNRPNDDITYTGNWPHEPLIGNRPTGESVIWTGVSIIMLLGGISAMIWWYASQKQEGEPASAPETDPLGNWRATASQIGRRAHPGTDHCRRHHRALRRRRRRLLWHQTLRNPALLCHSHLARPTRHLLDRHRMARCRPLHRTPGQRQGAQVPEPAGQRPVRRPAADRGWLAHRRVDEHHEQADGLAVVLLGPPRL